MSVERQFLDDMPKAVLHDHLDGAVKPEIIWRLAQEQGVILPKIAEQTQQALADFYRLPPDADFTREGEFRHFLDIFDVVKAVTQTPEGLCDAAYEHVKDLAAQSYVYAETRFAPQYHVEKDLGLEDVIGHVLRGLKKGERETGTMMRLIVAIGRECDQETSLAVVNAALAFQDRGVVGIDLACDEIRHPPEIHQASYRLTFGSKLRRTLHAGEHAADEDQRLKNIRTAISDLKADGLGHAVSLGRPENAGLAYLVNHKGVRVESCPLSNLLSRAIPRTSDRNSDLRWLALDALMKRGVLVSLNTDDEVIFNTSLADVFDATCQAYDFGVLDVQMLMRNAMSGAFCSEAERHRIFEEFKRRGFGLDETAATEVAR